MNWYVSFLAAVLLGWLFASPRDRMALRIVLLATLGSFLLTEGITRHIDGAWKLLFPGTVETLTIMALLHWSPNRTGYLQTACLLVAWLAHLLCYLDLQLGSNIVYDNYERIVGCVAVAQLAAFHDTGIHNIRRLADRTRNLWVRCAGRIRVASLRPAPFHDSRPPRDTLTIKKL